ncbi:MAG: hypothetical protein ACYTAO_23350 [Planctomycetota bacterium]
MSSRSWRGRDAGANRPYATLPDAIGGCPHPEFVEELMGFPIGYTDLEPSATPSCPKSQSGSGGGS